MNRVPRVALLADTFHEVNGAARTCRELADYAERQGHPFLTICYSRGHESDARHVELRRSRLAVRVDPDLYFDPLFHSDLARVEHTLREFQPDLIHITSPGDLGILGALIAHKMRLPLAISWHTNLHEFAGRRVSKMLWGNNSIASAVERFVLKRVLWFYSRADLRFAPNPELIDLVGSRGKGPVYPMLRGVDTRMFTPLRRTRSGDEVVIGYAGRLMPEKNVRFLAELERFLMEAGVPKFRFLIAGNGSERGWLERTMKHAEFTGVLHGEALAEAYANMDIFAFPSETDTFGNVVQEAMASGVPSVVTRSGGPQFIVEHDVDGFATTDESEFCVAVLRLARSRELRRVMSAAAVRAMQSRSWDRVFEEVYDGYRAILRACEHRAEASPWQSAPAI